MKCDGMMYLYIMQNFTFKCSEGPNRWHKKNQLLPGLLTFQEKLKHDFL